MSLHEKLRLYLADKHATFSPEGISWSDADGAHLLLAIEGPLSAAHIIDGHVRAMVLGAKLHLVHEGPANPVAQRTAARFQAELLDAAAFPEPTPTSVDDRMPWVAPTSPTRPAAPEASPDGFVAAPAVLERDAMPWDSPFDRAPPAPAPPPSLSRAEPELVIAASEPAPEVAHAEDAMPWGGEPSPLPEIVPAEVDPLEMLAVPWIHELESGVEALPAGRATRIGAGFRPTQAPTWGLPWPRPVVPTDGLSIADPKIWRTPERLTAMREDLDRAGAPSFGAAKPEGSAWLKRVSEYGPL